MSISKVVIASDTVGQFANKYNDLCDEVSALSSPVTPYQGWTSSTGSNSIRATNFSSSAVGDYGIAAGYLSQAHATRSGVFGGFLGLINGGAQSSVILGGNVSTIRTGSTNCAIIGGAATIIDSSLSNVAVIASSNILAAYSNSVYTPNLRFNSGYGLNYDSGSTSSPYFSSTTLSSGSKTITTSAAKPESLIFLTYKSTSNPGILSVTNGAGSFTINSSNASDASIVNWMIINPF